MIITRTPYRISFFGGGTDYPKWYQDHGGSVIATTIDKYCHISCRKLPPFFNHKHRIVYSNTEMVKQIEEIKHPAVRTVMQKYQIDDGLEVHYDGDLPSRTGIGSSSSFVVGFSHTMMALKGIYAGKRDLASVAVDIEQNLMGEVVGSQDQISATYGGFNRIDFNTNGGFEVSPMVISKDRLELFEKSCMLFFTGISRTASDVAKTQVDNFDKKQIELHGISRITEEATKVFHSSQDFLPEIGRLLNETWLLKRSLSSMVSNSTIDEIYTKAINAGALGGKILGAGGGGFILFLVEPDRQEQVKKSLEGLLHVNFKFETQGSRIIFYDP